jgi:Fic family protein
VCDDIDNILQLSYFYGMSVLPLNLSTLIPNTLGLLPPIIDKTILDEITPYLIHARTELAELKGYSSSLTNPLLLVAPLLTKESVASNEIENINTTIVDALQNILFANEEQNLNDKEVFRYRNAILYGYNQLSTIPISSRLILGIYSNLIPNNNPRFRNIQNAIMNTQTGEILLVPPRSDQIPELIKNWEVFANTDVDFDPLIKNIILHHQFESIHPFEDGNGRIGRILMILQMIQDGLLEYPILYLSGYISENKNEYYQGLQAVRKNNSWKDYIVYMLKATATQARKTKKTILEINQLFELQKNLIREKASKLYSLELLEVLFSYPIVTQKAYSENLKIHYTTATRQLNQLEKIGILTSQKVGKYKLFTNTELINVIQG